MCTGHTCNSRFSRAFSCVLSNLHISLDRSDKHYCVTSYEPQGQSWHKICHKLYIGLCLFLWTRDCILWTFLCEPATIFCFQRWNDMSHILLILCQGECLWVPYFWKKKFWMWTLHWLFLEAIWSSWLDVSSFSKCCFFELASESTRLMVECNGGIDGQSFAFCRH